MGLFLFGVALPAFFADFIEAGFGGGGLLRRGFNEADLPGFQLIRYSILSGLAIGLYRHIESNLSITKI